MSVSRSPSRRIWFLCVGLLLFWACLATVLRGNLGLSVPVFHDYGDRLDYFARGMWLPTHSVPYRDVMSEYPQIPTFIFGILYLPFLNQSDLNGIFFSYSNLFAFLMICLYFGLAIVLEKMLPESRKRLVLALLLPAPLYFAYNRFDVLPELMVVLALLMARDSKWESAAILLGMGALTKWYPGLLVVPFTAYMVSKKLSVIRIGFVLALFGLTCLLLLSPTYFAGGLKAVLSPYVRYDTQRGFDASALPALTAPLLQHLFTFPSDSSRQTLFFLLQISVLPVAALARFDSFERLLGWCLVTLSVFMLFSRIYSPQWLLWILPLMILLARDVIDAALIVAYGTLTYLEFPILYVGFGANPYAAPLLGWMNVVLLLWIILRAGKRLVQSSREADMTPGPPPAQDVANPNM